MHQLVQSAGAIEGERQESIHTIRCTFVAFSLTTVCVFFLPGGSVSRLLANWSTQHLAWLRAGVVCSEGELAGVGLSSIGLPREAAKDL
jgi:hypothetical protein